MNIREAVEILRSMVGVRVPSVGPHADAIGVVLAEVERVTTMVACVGCGNGVRWRHAVKEMCPDCATATVERLEAERDARRPGVCVAVVVEDASGRVLLLERGRSCSWPGHWCLPGGRLERGETLAGCCARELREETGLGADSFALEAVTEMADPPLVGVVFRAIGAVGVPENREPDRHDAVGWFSRDALPGPLMPGARQWHQGGGFLPSEVERLTAELDRLNRLTTRSKCAAGGCMRHVREGHAVRGMCRDCATAEIERLEANCRLLSGRLLATGDVR